MAYVDRKTTDETYAQNWRVGVESTVANPRSGDVLLTIRASAESLPNGGDLTADDFSELVRDGAVSAFPGSDRSDFEIATYTHERRYLEVPEADEIVAQVASDLVRALSPLDAEVVEALSGVLPSLRIPMFGSPPGAFLALVQVLQNRALIALVRSSVAPTTSVDTPTVCIASGATIVAVSFYNRVLVPTFDALGEVIPKWIRAHADEKIARREEDHGNDH